MTVPTAPAASARAAEGNRIYNQVRRAAISRANRILMAVGPEYVLPDPDDGEDLATATVAKRYKLVDDFRSAEFQYVQGLGLRGVSKQRRQKIQRGIRAAQYLKRLLNNELILIPNDRGVLELGDFLYPITKLDHMIYQLRARARSRKELELDMEYSAKTLHLHERSLIEWLTGIELPRIFEQHFHMKARVERCPDRNAAYRPPAGSYMRFARQFLIEFGIRKSDGQPYTDETIAKALTDVRSRRNRRKK
jgi:hypothetical protein